MSDHEETIKMLAKSYGMELETVINYISNSKHLDGLHAQEIRESLDTDIQEELGHAQRLASRIHVLGGRVPGSMDISFDQKSLQPPTEPLDIKSVVKGVIDAEKGAIEQYQKIIKATDGKDFVTQDLCIELKGDEEEHLREFEGFLRDIEQTNL